MTSLANNDVNNTINNYLNLLVVSVVGVKFMLKSNKRQPALTDLDLMPFGKYKGTLMQDVPASYLAWLKNEGCTNPLVANYIHNSWDAIESELND